MADEIDTGDAEAFEVSSADGNFYHGYKKQISVLLEAIIKVGGDAIQSGDLQQADVSHIEAALRGLRREERDFPRLLAKSINEDNPTFFQECTLASIIGLIEGVFLIGKHGGFTDSAFRKAQSKQVELMNEAQSEAREKARLIRITLVRRHAATIGADLSRPASTAEAIREPVNSELVRQGKRKVTTRTIQNWINEANEDLGSEIS